MIIRTLPEANLDRINNLMASNISIFFGMRFTPQNITQLLNYIGYIDGETMILNHKVNYDFKKRKHFLEQYLLANFLGAITPIGFYAHVSFPNGITEPSYDGKWRIWL